MLRSGRMPRPAPGVARGGVSGVPRLEMPETPTLAVAGRAYSGLHQVLNRLVYKDESWSLGTSVDYNP